MHNCMCTHVSVHVSVAWIRGFYTSAPVEWMPTYMYVHLCSVIQTGLGCYEIAMQRDMYVSVLWDNHVMYVATTTWHAFKGIYDFVLTGNEIIGWLLSIDNSYTSTFVVVEGLLFRSRPLPRRCVVCGWRLGVNLVCRCVHMWINTLE